MSERRALVPTPAGDVRLARLDIGAVLYDESRGRLHILDETAAVVWQLFDGKTTVDEIVSDLVDTLRAEEHWARHYVDALLGQLGDLEVVEVTDMASVRPPG